MWTSFQPRYRALDQAILASLALKIVEAGSE
jgi:hypothetical protein